MTLVTTFMTTPLLSFINFCFRTHEKFMAHKVEEQSQPGVFKVLLSFGRASNGQVMLDVAHQMFAHAKNKLEITALHLTVGSDVNPLHTDNFEEVSFGPILYGAQKLNIPLRTRYEVSNNAGQDICKIANEEGFDFLLVGAGISLSDLPNDQAVNRYRAFFYDKFLRHFRAPESWFYPGELLKDKTKMFIEQSLCPVGVFINRSFVKATHTLILIHEENDFFLLKYAETLQRTTNSELAIIDLTDASYEAKESVRQKITTYVELQHKAQIAPEKRLTQNLLSVYNFMLVSYQTWNWASEVYKTALQKMPSTLILSK